jgi:hypothetical protein
VLIFCGMIFIPDEIIGSEFVTGIQNRTRPFYIYFILSKNDFLSSGAKLLLITSYRVSKQTAAKPTLPLIFQALI